MFPEDGCLRVYGVGEDGVTAFTRYGTVSIRRGPQCCHFGSIERLRRSGLAL